MKWLCVIMSFLLSTSFSILSKFPKQIITVNKYEKAQVFESFGTSSCWWSQHIDDDAQAREIARALYDKETGLGLDIYRYNVGGGERNNPNNRIAIYERAPDSFLYLNEETGEYEFDFTRDANARRVLDYAVEYGASKVILFCNSPHYSMTFSGQASGGLTPDVSNLPKENYGEFVDYVLTIADRFVEQGYPIFGISPINEPQWGWGGEWVSQEGCHYTVEETVEVLELFATEMKKRNSPYKLLGPESGDLSEGYYEYIDKFFESEILNDFCDYYSGHSYWLDGNFEQKSKLGEKLKTQYPNKKLEMSEWCELPLKIDSTTIDSGIHKANVIIQDLTLMNAVSWQSWTAVNEDGVLDRVNGELVTYSRYWAFMHFTKFIKPGMQRLEVLDSFKDSSKIASVAFRNKDETVFVLVNNDENDAEIRFWGFYRECEIYTSDKDKNCENTYEGKALKKITLPARSITTIVYR